MYKQKAPGPKFLLDDEVKGYRNSRRMPFRLRDRYAAANREEIPEQNRCYSLIKILGEFIYVRNSWIYWQ